MSVGIPTSVAKSISRDIIRKTGRLLPEQFRARLDELGVIDELQRLRLWSGDGPARRGDGHHGFTFGDLWRFYCHCNSSKSIAAEKERSRSGKRLVESALLIRKALRRFKWTLRVNAAPVRWVVDEAAEPGEELMLHDDRPMIVGDLEAAIFAYTDDLRRTGNSLLARIGRKANTSDLFFRVRWERFARGRSGKPLDSIGARLFAIVFGGKVVDTDSYRHQRYRVKARMREAERAKAASKPPRSVRTKGQTKPGGFVRTKHSKKC
jgi:hypothetical protein